MAKEGRSRRLDHRGTYNQLGKSAGLSQVPLSLSLSKVYSCQSVNKVLMVCDNEYVERANSREGGVGIESQIISPKVYAKANQEKFAAIVLELDADGRPLVPTFMSSRIYFDMTTEEAKAENYTEVVRWAFDKPFHVRPPVGKPPHFLEENYNSPISLRPAVRGRSHGAVEGPTESAIDTLDTVARESAKLILNLAKEPDPSEVAYKAILDVIPLRERVYSALKDVVRSGSNRKVDIIHSFFEGLGRSWDYTPESGTFTRHDNDVLRYFFHDCFVGFVAISIQESQFDLLADFLSVPFFIPDREGRTGKTSTYASFRPALESLEHRNQVLKLNRISLHADVLSETHQHSLVPFSAFLEADFLLYLRGIIDEKLHWYPVSGLWLGRSFGTLRLFAKGQSARYFERIRPLLLGKSADELRALLRPYLEGERRLARFDYESLAIDRLLNLEHLATAT